MTFKRSVRKLVSVLLAVWFGLQAGTLSLAGFDGTFVFTAFTDTQTVVEPLRVEYTAGQTVEQALSNAGIVFGRESGVIEAVNGVYGSYTICMDGGAFDLSQSASDVTAVVIGTRTDDMQILLPLVRLMGMYTSSQDHVQNYAPARQAYDAALRAFRRSDEKQAAALLEALQNAIADYDAILSGARYTLHVTATQDGAVLQTPVLTFTDSYGNETHAVSDTVQLIAGTYTFSVSDGGSNSVRGSISVQGDAVLAVCLPHGEWFGEVRLTDGSAPFAAEQNADTLISYVPDCIDTVCLFAAQGADVPDRDNTRLYAVYTGTNGVDYTDVPRSWESGTASLPSLLSHGMDGCGFVLEVRYASDDGFTAVQRLPLQITRIPTLSALRVTADGEQLPLLFDPLQNAYTLVTSADTLCFDASRFDDAYTVDGSETVAANCGTHSVVVRAQEQSNTYTVQIERRDAVRVTAEHPDGTTMHVYNAAGVCIAPKDGVYFLTPQQTYSYVTEQADHSFATAGFIAQDGLHITAAQPDGTDALEDLALYSASSPRTRVMYAFAPAFTSDVFAYDVTVEDASAVLYAQATTKSGWSAAAIYTRQTASADTNGITFEKSIETTVSDTGSATFLNACLLRGGSAQTVTFRVSREENDVTYYQDCIVHIRRSLHLSALSVTAGQTVLPLRNAAGETTLFSRGTTDYTLETEPETDALTLCGAFVGDGYFALVNGQRADDLSAYTFALDDLPQQTVSVEVRHSDPDAVPVTYTLLLRRTEPVEVRFQTEPFDATVFLTRDDTLARVPVRDGVCRLTRGAAYTCIVTANGYVGQKLFLTAPQTDDTIDVVLAAAPASVLPQIDAQPRTGRNADNNGVTNAPIPYRAEDAMLYWATKLGEGTGADACGCPILAGDYLYTYAGLYVYKIDPVSGEVLAQGEMDRRSGFAIQTPTYAEGMLFVGLSDGAVQAFRADTLEPLWIYHNARGGQPNCPITYYGGCVYTGFWLDEQADADFVCLSVTDEDPLNTSEEKLPRWTYTHAGGFYWAGAYACGDFVLVGTEDSAFGSQKGFAQIFSFAPQTGGVLDSVRLPHTGDVRSSITFADGTAYFTTRSGYFDALDVTPQGTFGTLRTLRLQNGDADSVPMSTSTPTVYGGRAFIGVSGASQFTAYSGHNLTVIDLVDFTVAYTLPTQGFAQTSGLLTTAYEADSGFVYVYFFDNYTPGKLRVLRDKAGQTAPQYTMREHDLDTAYTLFTPKGAHAQYALCSPVADENGTLYFKNDSGYLFALGSRVRTLEITSQPAKRSYTAGETFEADGMHVQATFADGSVRDVTDYVRYSAEPLTEDDTEFWIEYPFALYHDAADTVQMPFAVLHLEIAPQSVLTGDADGDGLLTAADAQTIYAFLAGVRTLNANALRRADFDGDGAVTAADARALCDYLTE